MRADTKYKIKKYSQQMKDALFYGAFAVIVPGFLFAGLASLVVLLLGLRETIPMTAIYSYGAACAGVWVGSAIVKQRIRESYYANKSREEILDALD
jgi:hypothetical protein